MTRHADWPQRLDSYIDACRGAQFDWGTHDCCRFAAKAVQAMTGEDRMAAFTYRSELGAKRLIRKAGSLDALLYRTLGETLPSVALAGRGDVVLADLERGPTVGVCMGSICAFAADPVGVAFRPLLISRLAWRID